MASLKLGSSSRSPHSEAARQLFDDQDIESSHGALEDHKYSLEFEDAPKGVTPLPKAQLATLCAIRLVDPIAFTQIFPYVNEMMERLHLTDDPNKIGFYSGLVESSFAVSQLCCIYNWARISGKQFIAATVTLVVSEVVHPDKIGRRPVVLTGILGIGLSTMILGTAHSLAAIILARCVGG